MAVQDSKMSPAGARPGRWKRRLRIFAGVLAVLLVVVWFAPQIVVSTALRHELPRMRMTGFKGAIRVGSASVSWLSPPVLENVEVDDLDGQPLVRVERISDNRPLWRMLLGRGDAAHLRIERPVVSVRLRKDGSNVEDALRPLLQRKERTQKQRKIEVVDAVIQVNDGVSGQALEWNKISLAYSDEPTTKLRELALKAELADAPDAGPVEVNCKWSPSIVHSTKSFGQFDADLNCRKLPLRALAPVLERFAGETALAGTVTTDLTIRIGSATGVAESMRADVSGRIDIEDAEVASPAWLGSDRPVIGRSTLDGHVAFEGVNWHFDKVHFESDVGDLHATGNLPAAWLDDSGRSAPSGDFALRGQIDLVRLAELFPQTLRVRPDTQLTAGRALWTVTSGVTGGRPQFTAKFDIDRLEGTVDGEHISWTEPPRLVCTFGRHAHGFEIESLACQSEAFELTARGRGDRWRMDGRCDLERLSARLGQFLDLGESDYRGQVTVAVDIHRAGDGISDIRLESTVEDLLIRRQVTRMVERRAGDVRQIDVDEPVEPPPGPPPGARVDARTKRDMRRAEREAEKQRKRREKEARRKADEIVLVPVQQWKTVWSDPKLALHGQMHYDRGRDVAMIDSLELLTEGATVSVKGSISEAKTRAVADISGAADYDLERLLERLRESVGPHIQVVGKEQGRFSLRGPLRGPVDEWQGGISGGWKHARLFGLAAGAGEVDVRLEHDVLGMQPLELALSNGRLLLAPRLELATRPAELVMPAGPLVENVELTQEVCDAWLMYIAPVLAQATRVEGTFSVELADTRLPLSDPGSGDLAGKLHIATAQVLPGPLFDEISGLIGRIQALVERAPPRDLIGLDRPLVHIDDQRVDFHLEDRRVHQSALEFSMRNVKVRTRGSVGVDESLDLVADIVLPDAWKRSMRSIAKVEGDALSIPIRGTLRHPKLDARPLGRLAQEFGEGALEQLINGGLQKLFDRD